MYTALRVASHVNYRLFEYGIQCTAEPSRNAGQYTRFSNLTEMLFLPCKMWASLLDDCKYVCCRLFIVSIPR